jgi:cytochrome c nitrite reductase small subunit
MQNCVHCHADVGHAGHGKVDWMHPR